MNEPSVHERKSSASGIVGWIVVAAAGALLGAAIWYGFWLLNPTDASTDAAGAAALIGGAVLAMALGAGLMTLLFYSHRKGFDR